jgi:exopolyphosphatase / guanosine-5'-triphosphate,3'-diphosphate pyrophosphatase
MSHLQTVGLDIGSNTVSCTQLRLGKHGRIRVRRDKSFPVRLSEGLVPGGKLKPEAVMRALMAIEQIVSKFDYCSSRSRAVATAVLRIAGNPEVFTKPAEEILGTPIEIVDGTEEARLTAIGAVFGLPERDDWAILDIGGQSTEISSRETDGTWRSISMPLGVVGVTEKYFSSETPSEAEQQHARTMVRRTLEKNLPIPVHGHLVCVGGTPTTLSRLVHGMTEWNREMVHGSVVSQEDTHRWMGISSTLDVTTRIEKYGMKPMRADVFPAGVLILREMMNYLSKESFTVSANGLRVGLALSLLNG